MDSIEIESHSIDDTLAVGAAVARWCRSGDIIALIGELGAGKTQFVRGLAMGLGLDPAQVNSPTFVIAHEYELPQSTVERASRPSELEDVIRDRAAPVVLAHLDAYRLSGEEDLAAIGWAGAGGDLGEGAITAIEWADRVAHALGEDRLEVHMSHVGENQRHIRLIPRGRWRDRLPQLRNALSLPTV